MITNRKNECQPQRLRFGEIPDYVCRADGSKHYLSKQEKKDYEYGGSCPSICPLKGDDARKGCPNVDWEADPILARSKCESGGSCQFVGNQVFDRMGPNYCVPKSQPGCLTLGEQDYLKSDKFLTDSPQVCDRFGKGCIFHRGNDDPKIGRSGNPTCLRGCLGSKYWGNPKYLWGGGGGLKGNFEGSFLSPDLQLGPIYLEAAPSSRHPQGWGGIRSLGGSGLLPPSLGLPYTETKGKLSPPCNKSEGDLGAFTTDATGEDLAGPGCRLTPPMPQYGEPEWSYTCGCVGGAPLRIDAWAPCPIDDESVRDVCRGCHIESDKANKLYGHCVLGESQPDTESDLLGCVPTPQDPEKCRVKRIVPNTECPHFCTTNPKDPKGWMASTQCYDQLSKGCWGVNPDAAKVISKEQRDLDQVPQPYIPGPLGAQACPTRDTDDLCKNCAQTSVKTVGVGTQYPNRSYCVVGGNMASLNIDADFTQDLAREITCPVTCSGCHTGFFGEPMKPVYNLLEAGSKSSVFNKGPIFMPWIGDQAEKALDVEKKKFK